MQQVDPAPARRPGTPTVVAAAWRRFRDDWRELLLFNFVFQAAAFVVLAPLGNGLLVQLVSTSGRLALSNEPVRLRTVLREREALSDQEKILLALRNGWWR